MLFCMCHFTSASFPDTNRVSVTWQQIGQCKAPSQNLILSPPGQEMQSPLLRGNVRLLNPFNLSQVKVLKPVQVYSSIPWKEVSLAGKEKGASRKVQSVSHV